MKKIVTIMLFAFALVSQSFAESGSGLFWRASAGYDYVNISEESSSLAERKWHGNGGDIELSFGYNINSLLAFYAGLDFSAFSGELGKRVKTSESNIYSYGDAALIEYGLSIGAVLMPFQSIPVVKGALLGFGVGYGITEVYKPSGMVFDDHTIDIKIELGYLWNISEKMRFGLVGNVKPKFLFGDVDMSGVSFGVDFTIMRK